MRGVHCDSPCTPVEQRKKTLTSSSGTDAAETDSTGIDSVGTTAPSAPPSQTSSASASRSDLDEEVSRLDKQLVAMQARLDSAAAALKRSHSKNEQDKEAALVIEKRLLNQVHQLEKTVTAKADIARQSEAKCKQLEQKVLQFDKKRAAASSGWNQEKQRMEEKNQSLAQVVAERDAQIEAALEQQTEFDSKLDACRDAAEAAEKASAEKIARLEHESDELRTGCKQLTDKVDSLMKEVITLRSITFTCSRAHALAFDEGLGCQGISMSQTRLRPSFHNSSLSVLILPHYTICTQRARGGLERRT